MRDYRCVYHPDSAKEDMVGMAGVYRSGIGYSSIRNYSSYSEMAPLVVGGNVMWLGMTIFGV